jgi:hypothetical protein
MFCNVVCCYSKRGCQYGVTVSANTKLDGIALICIYHSLPFLCQQCAPGPKQLHQTGTLRSMGSQSVQRGHKKFLCSESSIPVLMHCFYQRCKWASPWVLWVEWLTQKVLLFTEGPDSSFRCLAAAIGAALGCAIEPTALVAITTASAAADRGNGCHSLLKDTWGWQGPVAVSTYQRPW